MSQIVDPDEFMERAAHRLAKAKGLPLDVAQQQVRQRIDAARAAYLARGSPFGDTFEDLLIWLVTRP